MKLNLHFKSIAMRWLFKVYLIIALAVVAIAIILSTLFTTLIYNTVQSQANDYAHAFENLASVDKSSFYDTAVILSDEFEYKTKIEVQVISDDGKVIVSTTGFQPSDDIKAEYNRASASLSGIANYRGKNSGGERIMAETHIVRDSAGQIIGAYRWVTSLKAAYKNINIIIVLIIGISLLVLVLCAISGLFFLKEIVVKLRAMGNTTRKIAGGDFKARIETSSNDEIGELGETINHMASELQTAETMKNDFISSVSHELRTPLTAIRGWGETARMSLGTDEDLVARGLDVVLSEADRLSGLVEDLLDFSRMQSGRMIVNNVQPIDVSHLLVLVADMYTELAVKQGIELSYTPPVQSSIVMADSDRLKQVFINVIDNAVKYTEKGGLVLVAQAQEEEGCVRIVVKDTGVGIPAEDIDRVKEKFFKSNKTVRGSGIGLAVADEIIKQHHGLLFVESTEGVGTTVTIVLPLYEEPEEEKVVEEIIEPLDNNQTELPLENCEEDSQQGAN